MGRHHYLRHHAVNGILEVLTQNILPIFLVAGLGFWLRRAKNVETRPVASVVFNGFSPALVFASLVKTELPAGHLAQLALFTVLSIAAMGVVGLVAGRLIGLCKADMVVLLLCLMFVNGGNYGMTLNQLRYGDTGLSLAIVYYITSTILAYSVGVFIVSMGRRTWRESLKKLASVPAIYAVGIAIVVYSFDLPVPGPLMEAIELASDGAIPAMILVLGMNMADMTSFGQLRLTVPAASLRLLAGPLLALAIASIVGLQGLNRSVAVIEASMPTAVLTTVLATEFDVQPATVTSIVVLSTVLSPITLSLFINLLVL